MLNLAYNNMTPTALKNLLDDDFPLLKKLNLSTYMLYQIPINLEMKEC